MKKLSSNLFAAARIACVFASHVSLRATCGLTFLVLAACNGTAVVTLTSTASPDLFLAYRVKLVAVQLQPSSAGAPPLDLLPTPTTADLTRLDAISEILGAATAAKGGYRGATVTVDYSGAQIVYDDGTLSGLALTPVSANGQALGQVRIAVTLDPSDPFRVVSGQFSRLALDFKLAASNVVDVTAKTVTVTPMIAASALPTDAKQVRIRGPLLSVGSANPAYVIGVMPFDDNAVGEGQVSVAPTAATTYEINGIPSTGSTGIASPAGLANGMLTVAYGTLNAANAATTAAGGATSSSSNVSFDAAQVLAGSSVQGAALDRFSGIVSARSGNILIVEDGTLVGVDGSDTLVAGPTSVIISANTAVTVFGQGAAEINSAQQISVGSSIDAFGTATLSSAGIATVDASAGRVRLGTTTASGLVTAQGTGVLTLELATLDGRAVGAFDFAGSGVLPAQYTVRTGALDLSNAALGSPVTVAGEPGAFGLAAPNLSAATLFDVTTIQAQLVVDYGTGTAAPFVTYDSSAIDLDIHNRSIALRHRIQVGPQSIDMVGLSSDPLIVPDATTATTIFVIGHAASTTVETFNTYAAFISRLRAELNGTTLVRGLTAAGLYTASSFKLNATSITVFLNN